MCPNLYLENIFFLNKEQAALIALLCVKDTEMQQSYK